MTVADALLLALGAIAVGAGALVVSTAHLVRAGLYLVISLGAVAGLYLVMGAELVAWVQVLVYVGAVVVLLLFAVMLTRAPIGPSRDLDRPAGPAALVGAGVGLGLAALLADAFHWTAVDLPAHGTAARIGEQVFGGWVLPFEVLSILLLAALVGAIVLSRPDLGARRGPQQEPEPAGPVGPHIDESAAVVARLERIAARQAAAQGRVRAAASAERAAAAPVPEPEPVVDPAAVDPAAAALAALKEQAHGVVFGAHERVHESLRDREAMPPEPPRNVKSSTPGAAPSRRAAPRALEDAIEGEVLPSPDPSVPGRPPAADRPALPSAENPSRRGLPAGSPPHQGARESDDTAAPGEKDGSQQDNGETGTGEA